MREGVLPEHLIVGVKHGQHVPLHTVKGFTMSVAKQVLNGRMDSVIRTMERNIRLV